MVVETGVNDEDGLEHCSQHYSGAQADDNCTGYDSETSSDDMDINAGQRMLIAFYCSSRMHVLQFQYCWILCETLVPVLHLVLKGNVEQ